MAVNLYPFRETLQKLGANPENEAEIIENIDIGGPSMLRSAAKNHASVAVVVDPADYGRVLEALPEIPPQMLRDLAAKAFRHTAAYDSLIAAHFYNRITENSASVSKPDTVFYPEKLTITYELKQHLRYGENPHQSAALYADPLPGNTIIAARQLHGKELSYNNIADADVTLEMVREFDLPAAVAVKHQNPCGVGTGETIAEAYTRAFDADPVSIFGGIIALNREVCGKTAAKMSETFLEIIIAPKFSADALEILTKKKNLRLLEISMDAHCAQPISETHNASNPFSESQKILQVSGGLLIQARDAASFDTVTLTFPTKRKPTEAELATLKFAWTCVKYVKSNGILVARRDETPQIAGGCMTIGIGPGQTNRVGAAKIALGDAGERARGAVLASDAFFPMPDTVELAAAAGITAIIQPGGSVKDSDSIAACDKHGIAMVFTGVRHFRH